jgi:hypothetical protein
MRYDKGIPLVDLGPFRRDDLILFWPFQKGKNPLVVVFLVVEKEVEEWAYRYAHIFFPVY